ncbi:MAG: hypothetical protein HC908_03465 [Calothrix sp. SM1_7_51]|nr:hypothetical protein [Calothrix sp. SM1_7_51]
MSQQQYKNNAIEPVHSSPNLDINSHDFKAEHILVCGLGKLGQFCVKFLHEFGIPIIGIDIKDKDHINWVENNILNFITRFLSLETAASPIS